MGKGKFGEEVFDCCVAAFHRPVVILGIVYIGLGISKFVIGAMYLPDCDIEKMIPIFLIVSAFTSILNVGLGKKNDDDGFGWGAIIGMIGFLFNSAWQVCGSVWVYGTWGKVKSDSYIPCNGANFTEGCTQGTCNDTLLNFSFGMVTLDWIFTGLLISIVVYTIIRVC